MSDPSSSSGEAAMPPDAPPTTPPVSGGERTIDFDAARKARREQKGPAPELVFLGNRYPLPSELPADVIDLVADVEGGDFTAVTRAMRVLIGGEELYAELVEKAKAAGDPLTLDDVTFLLESALEVYEVTLPESSASAG